MPQNGIRAQGIVELAKSIGTSANLRFLNLNDNTFTVTGARAMARAIRNIECCLEVVDFGDCLCRSGAIDIIEAIADNHSETIQVSLIQLSINTRFKKIDLTGNELTRDQAMTIIDICAEFPNIESLKLGLNSYGSQFQEILDYIQNEENGLGFVDLGEEE